jgi:hypothetical protein
VQTESTRRLAPAIKAWNNVAVEVHHLAFPIDPKTRARVVDHRRGPRGMKRGSLDLEFRRGLSEVGVFATVYKELYRATVFCSESGGIGFR